MNSAFNDQILADKLKKLNNSQQSIETLSHWCIFHRKKAQLVVETWDRQLRELPKEQRVPFLYLANDILQNSRRRGAEFVTEFWKILPGALKNVIEKGDNQAQNVVLRLVDIWDERKVFGSRARTLREELLGNDPPADLSERRVKSNHTIKIKVPVGGIQEKLTSAYRSVNDVASDEDATLGRCNAAVIRIEGLEKEANNLRSSRELEDITTLAEELQEQQNILSHCIEQLEISELARAALVSHLKEALREQESKLELIRTQLQTSQAQAEHSGVLRQRLLSSSSSGAGEIIQLAPREDELDGNRASAIGDKYQWPPLPATGSVASVIDESKKPMSIATSAAAEVAAKLAASTSSVQVLTSVLSSMVAEEASSMRTASAPSEAPSGTFFPDKRRRVDGQRDHVQSTEGSAAYVQQFPPPLQLQSTGLQPYSGSVQLHAFSSQQAQHHYPPPPPLPPRPQNMEKSATIIMQALGYTGVFPPSPPPPPMQGQLMVGTPQMVVNLHNANAGTYQALQPPGVGFYGQRSLPATHLPRH